MSRCLHLLHSQPCKRSRLAFKASFNIVARPFSHLIYVAQAREGVALNGLNDLNNQPQDAEIQERLKELNDPLRDLYPQISPHQNRLTCGAFSQRYAHLTKGETRQDDDVVITGRLQSFRVAGPKLVFIDLLQEGHVVQGLCNFRGLEDTGVTEQGFKVFYHKLRRGDILSIRGYPHKTNRGELSVLAAELPCLLSPCLHHLPTELQDKQTRARNRHEEYLVNLQSANVIRLRSDVINHVRQSLLSEAFIEVQTPILAQSAGGAIARSFKTSASEFSDRQLSLRIAPELWLKRLILGGFDRVFEIGPSFRNEGIDQDHNPEFTTCEFYKAYAGLEELIQMTETMFSGLAESISVRTCRESRDLRGPEIDFRSPFKRLDFISTIEAAISRKLPELTSPEALSQLLRVFQELSIPLPANRTVPDLLDRLSASYLEPRCSDPTWIVNHPESLSPLSKSFDHPDTHQRVAARAELFVNCREIVNTYEEENSPFEQRRKFMEQLMYRREGDDMTIDEGYLEALEWGLPPTGGWGCGIDRLCMLMSGATRISDVLSFGHLRNVVASRKR